MDRGDVFARALELAHALGETALIFLATLLFAVVTFLVVAVFMAVMAIVAVVAIVLRPVPVLFAPCLLLALGAIGFMI
jgi:hypothetical protein